MCIAYSAIFQFLNDCHPCVWTSLDEYLVIIIVAQNLVYSLQFSFERMQISMLWKFGLKTPIYAAFGGVFGAKVRGKWKLLQFYPSRNAIICDSGPLNQTA